MVTFPLEPAAKLYVPRSTQPLLPVVQLTVAV